MSFSISLSILDVLQIMQSGSLTINTCPVSFHEKLEERLKDSFKANVIMNRYTEKLEALSDRLGLQERFEKWLLVYSAYLGSSDWDPFSYLNMDQDLQGLTVQANDELKEFFRKIYEDFSPLRKQIVSLTSSKVDAIILTTTRCGNGHLAAAQGMQHVLNKHSFSVPIIDRDQASVFSNQGAAIMVSYDRYKRLRELVAHLGPRIIFSTASHDWNDIPLSYELNVPMKLIQTDYEMHPSLAQEPNCPCSNCLGNSFFDILSGSQIKIWIATSELDANSEKVKKRIGEEKFSSYVEPFGFPIRDSFKREKNVDELNIIRSNLGIHPNEQLVLMTYGGKRNFSASQLLDWTKQLNETKETFNHPLLVVVVCGKDQATFKDIMDYLSQANSSHPLIRFRVEQFISETEMADYSKAASIFNSLHGLMIGKGGGSTIAENCEMGVYMLGISDEISERANLEHLTQMGLGQILQSPANLILPLKQALEMDASSLRGSLPDPIDWKSRLLNEMHKMSQN